MEHDLSQLRSINCLQTNKLEMKVSCGGVKVLERKTFYMLTSKYWVQISRDDIQ